MSFSRFDLRRTWARCHRHRVRAIGFLLVWLCAPALAIAQSDASVKVAFVFNFLRFTEWPARRFAAPDSPMWLCVWSFDARLSEAMKALNGRSVDDRPVRVADIDRPEDLGQCHALFVTDGAPRGAASAWLRRAESLDLLTMGDGDAFAASGGMIGLVADGPRMRFEVNDKAVKRSGLKLAAQLYQLGRSVPDGATK